MILSYMVERVIQTHFQIDFVVKIKNNYFDTSKDSLESYYILHDIGYWYILCV